MEFLLYWLALIVIVTAFNFALRSNEDDKQTEDHESPDREPLFDVSKPSLWRRLQLRWKFQWKYLPRDIKIGVLNIVKWFKVIWNDRDWDRSHLLEMMIFKMRNMADYHESRQFYVGWENNVKWMRLCAELLGRVSEEYYSAEFSEFYEIDLTMDRESDERGFVQVYSNIISQRFDEYFKKYPREYELAKKQYPDVDVSTIEGKKTLGFMMSIRLQNKARRIAFAIMNEHVEKWWD